MRVPRSSSWIGTTAWIAATALIFAGDILTTRFNLGMAHLLVLSLLLTVGHRRTIRVPALVMSACVFAAYFCKPFPEMGGFGERLLHPRFVNRSMIVLVLLATALLAPRLASGLDTASWRWRRGDGTGGDEVMFLTLARSVAGIAAVALLAGALLFDLATPVSINGTVLVPLALLWAVQAGDQRLMLWLIPSTIVVTLVALARAFVSQEIQTYMLVNRSIAAVASSALAVELYEAVRRAARRPDPISIPEAQARASDSSGRI